jgi:UDP-glucose 4-epimerase
MRSNNIFIIGWRGFIGRNLINWIRNNSNDRNIYLYDKDNAQEEFPFVDTNVHQIFYSDMVGLLNKIDNANIIYLANSYSPHESLKYIVESVSENLIPMVSLLADIKENSKNIRFIFSSSGGSVYGDTAGEFCNEKHRVEPKTIYAANKVAQELYLEVFNTNFGLKYISLRIANPYGPGQFAKGGQGLIPTIMCSIRDGKQIVIYGNGSSKRDYIYIDDLCECILLACDYDGKEKVMNIGSGVPKSINDILKCVTDVTKKPIDKVHVDPLTENVDSIVLDISRTLKELNWYPKTSLYEGMSAYISWFSKLVNQNKN